jgi:uncharacterized protein YkwD
MLKRSWFFTGAVLLLVFCAQANPALASRQSATPKPLSADKIISLTNAARTQNGLPALVTDKKLTIAAQKKAVDMAAIGLFAHDMPDGRHPWDYITAAGYAYSNAGENLAVHFVTETDVVNAWMNSLAHRKNILSKEYKDIGIGIAYGTFDGRPGYLIVQQFGRKL